MKKLTCTLLVAMFSMTAMVLAQTIGFPSVYFTITNKNTQESKMVPANKFTSEGNNKFTHDVDFCLGVYNNDEIEITYTSVLATSTPLWSYFWNNDASYSLGTALTANLSVTNIPYDKSELTVTCNTKGIDGASKSYNIHFKNVHTGKRVYISYNNVSHEVLVFYENYGKEVVSCANQTATTALFEVPIGGNGSGSGNMISTGSLNAVGMGTLATKGKTGPFLDVKVFVNNVAIFTEKIAVQ